MSFWRGWFLRKRLSGNRTGTSVYKTVSLSFGTEGAPAPPTPPAAPAPAAAPAAPTAATAPFAATAAAPASPAAAAPAARAAAAAPAPVCAPAASDAPVSAPVQASRADGAAPAEQQPDTVPPAPGDEACKCAPDASLCRPCWQVPKCEGPAPGAGVSAAARAVHCSAVNACSELLRRLGFVVAEVSNGPLSPKTVFTLFTSASWFCISGYSCSEGVINYWARNSRKCLQVPGVVRVPRMNVAKLTLGSHMWAFFSLGSGFLDTLTPCWSLSFFQLSLRAQQKCPLLVQTKPFIGSLSLLDQAPPAFLGAVCIKLCLSVGSCGPCPGPRPQHRAGDVYV